MRIVPGAERPAELPRGAVVTIGNFDGLHVGQQAIVDRTIARARELGLFSALLTFDPHPLTLLAPERVPELLTSDAQREALLAAAGLDELRVVPFTTELAAMVPDEFVARYLIAELGAREVHVGAGFRFGRGREGDLARLAATGAGAGLTAVGHGEIERDGAPVSATRIRAALRAGEVGLAAGLLGRPHAVSGVVERGDQVGRQLGFPTANLVGYRNLLPADGVYVTMVVRRSSGRDAEPLPSVTNVGVRPTRDGSGVRRVEVHLLDFDGDLYGEALELGFHRRLRGEKRFPSLEALRSQIAADVAIGREYFRVARRSRERAGLEAGLEPPALDPAGSS